MGNVPVIVPLVNVPPSATRFSTTDPDAPASFSWMWKVLIGLPRLLTVIVTVMFWRVESNVTVALPKPGVVVAGTS